jgi:acylphosphatase
MRNLTTPIIETNTANQIQVTGFVDNREDGRVEIHYMLLLEDGTPYKRNVVQFSGEDINDFYASIGVDFESQVKEKLYAKVMENI